MTEQTATQEALAALDDIIAAYNRSFGYDHETRDRANAAKTAVINKNHLDANHYGGLLRQTCGKLGTTAADAIARAVKPQTKAFVEQWNARLEANRDRYAG